MVRPPLGVPHELAGPQPTGHREDSSRNKCDSAPRCGDQGGDRVGPHEHSRPSARTGSHARTRTVARGPASALSRAAWASICDSTESAKPFRVFDRDAPERSEISQHAASCTLTERAQRASSWSDTSGVDCAIRPRVTEAGTPSSDAACTSRHKRSIQAAVGLAGLWLVAREAWPNTRDGLRPALSRAASRRIRVTHWAASAARSRRQWRDAKDTVASEVRWRSGSWLRATPTLWTTRARLPAPRPTSGPPRR